MVKLYASKSSEVFAVREPRRLSIYRGGYLDVVHPVNDKVAGDLIHLADNGDCFFRSSSGLFRLRREKGVRAERCRAVLGLDGTPEKGSLRGFVVRADGEQVAYEQVLPAQKFSSKLKRFLGQKSASGDVGPSLHRFVISRWSGRGSACYCEKVIDPRVSSGLVWWAADDFGFLAIIERGRSGRSTLRVIDVLDEAEVSEFVLEGRLSRDRFLTAKGTVGFGLEKSGHRTFVIWTYSQDRYQVAYPKDSRVIHLDSSKVVFFNKKLHRMVAKNLNNEVVSEASLAPLAELGVEYLLNFNRRGTIELVTYQGNQLRVHHTDLDSLPVDARRWELIGERQRAAQIEEQTEQILQRENAARTAEADEQRRQSLLQEINPAVPKRDTSSFATPDIQDTPLPIERVNRPVAPPALSPDPPSPPAIPKALDLELPSTGAANTDSGSPNEHAVPLKSEEEAQVALERLRMRYIAGELTREAYYTEKTAIEAAVSAMPATLPLSLAPEASAE